MSQQPGCPKKTFPHLVKSTCCFSKSKALPRAPTMTWTNFQWKKLAWVFPSPPEKWKKSLKKCKHGKINTMTKDMFQEEKEMQNTVRLKSGTSCQFSTFRLFHKFLNKPSMKTVSLSATKSLRDKKKCEQRSKPFWHPIESRLVHSGILTSLAYEIIPIYIYIWEGMSSLTSTANWVGMSAPILSANKYVVYYNP